jgi:hypothetical protein
MGGGESKYVEDQEKFVRNNVEAFKKALPEHYSHSQIKGKLRQLYANSDTNKDNRSAYVLEYEWKKAKAVVVPVYSSTNEANGHRRYR